MEHIPIILDTDIGTNIDDALALWCLLHDPRCELLGVTTVTGQPHLRARIAKRLCIAAGRPDVPVVAGAAEPREGPQQQTHVPLAPPLADLPSIDVDASAVDFLADRIARRPGDITLLSIGPMTNVARLFADRPEAAADLRAIVAMMGRFDADPTRRDTNFALDPAAVRAVLSRVDVPMRLVGLDATQTTTMPTATLLENTGDVAQSPLLPLIDAWVADHETTTLHDPLTAFAALHDASLAWQIGRLFATSSSIDIESDRDIKLAHGNHSRLCEFSIFSFRTWFLRRLRGERAP